MLRPRLVHSSSVYSMGIWATAFVALMAARPGVDLDLVRHGPGLSVIGCSFAAFFAILLTLQRRMGLSPAATRFGRPKALIVDGPFRFSRNPIYCLFLLPIAALGIYSLPAAFITGTIYVWTMNRLVICSEEVALTAQFGDDYRQYAAKTPRWLLFRSPLPDEERGHNYPMILAILCCSLIVGIWLGRHFGGDVYWLIMSPV